MDSALAAYDPLEVLDDIGQVDVLAVDSRVGEGPVEQLPGGADERTAEFVLLVSGLLADEHRLGVRWALAEHDLRRGLVEVAGRAFGSLSPELVELRSDHAFAVPRGPPPESRATMAPRGAVAERLGRGLQSLVQRFESARRLAAPVTLW